jgi:hypothetical protein
MEPWQERLIEERDQLAKRLEKLDTFLWRKNIPTRETLQDQRLHMRRYLGVLNLRIAQFPPPRYTYLVTIEQEDPHEGRNFGAKEDWASLIKHKLGTLQCVKIVSVEPQR